MAEIGRAVVWGCRCTLVACFVGPVMLGEAASAESLQKVSDPSTITVWGKVASWQVKNTSAINRVLELGEIGNETAAAKLYTTTTTTTTTPMASGSLPSAAKVNENTTSVAPMQANDWQVKKESDVGSRGKAVRHPRTRGKASDATAAASLTTTSTMATSTSILDPTKRGNASDAPAAASLTTTSTIATSTSVLDREPQSTAKPTQKNFTRARSNRSHEPAAAIPTTTSTITLLTSTQAQSTEAKEDDKHADFLAKKKLPLAAPKVNKTAAKQNNTGRPVNEQTGPDGLVTPQSHSNSSAADDNTARTTENKSSNASGNSRQLQYCIPENHTREKHLIASVEEKAPKGSYAAGTIVVVCCAEGYGGSRTSWQLNCKANGQWKAHYKGQKSTSLPDCRPVNCSTPHDPLGTWHAHGMFNESVELVCAEGFVPDSGSSVIPCIGRTIQPARCVPGRGSAAKWRSQLKRDALLRLLGAVAIVALVIVLCWRDPLEWLGAQQRATTTDDGHTGLGDRLVEPHSQRAVGLPQGTGFSR